MVKACSANQVEVCSFDYAGVNPMVTVEAVAEQAGKKFISQQVLPRNALRQPGDHFVSGASNMRRKSSCTPLSACK